MDIRDPSTGYLVNKWSVLSQHRPDAGLRALSLGVGVQSSTLALMAARGDVGPMPDCAIFANTGWEPAKVYAYLEWLAPRLPFPIIEVRRAGQDLGQYHMETARIGLKGRPTVPLYTADPDGMMSKQCSKEFKTRVVQREIRRQLGLSPKERAPKGMIAEVWIGISKDEIVRVKRSETAYIHNRHPLVECDMTRQDCLKWLEDRQLPRPPKSSCVFCPFRDNPAWIRMGRDEPDDFRRAIEFDDASRQGYPGMEGLAYVHRNRIPLRDLDLDQPITQGDLFEQEQCDACGS